jgi:Domain of unknown function (DUF4148)
MNKMVSAGVSMVLVALAAAVTTNASAQEKTRAEVRQELIQAEANGSRFVTDTSYPEVSPLFANQVARAQKQSDNGVGADMSGAIGTGHHDKAKTSVGAASPVGSCVDPVTFCTPYFGS